MLTDIQPDGVLNEATKTIHKHQTGEPELHTVCGATHHVAQDHLSSIPIDRATDRTNVSKCGRCFSDAGGY